MQLSYNPLDMQGNPRVIAELNAALREELTAINQYFLHAEMCENWKYDKLGAYIRKQSIDEMKHAELLHRAHLVSGCHAQHDRVDADQRR